MFNIKSRFDSTKVIFSCKLPKEIEAQDYSIQLGYAIQQAIKANKNLQCSNLQGANLYSFYLLGVDCSGTDLTGADLTGANLTGVNFSGANLTGANFSDADFTDVDFSGADLTRANFSYAHMRRANFSNINFSDAKLLQTNFSGAYMQGAILPDEVPHVPDLDKIIYYILTTQNATLEMGDWHKCETTHCRYGWAIHLAGPAGYALQTKLGPLTAGTLIYVKAYPQLPVPACTGKNDDVLADIKLRAGL